MNLNEFTSFDFRKLIHDGKSEYPGGSQRKSSLHPSESISLYHKVDERMSDPEKALAFQHNRTVLGSADLDQRAGILTLADRLNLTLTAEAGLADWERKLSRNWSNFQYLRILSWHDEKGARINNTTTPGDTSILLHVQDSNIADCRAAGVKFVRVQLDLDFADLTIAANPAPNVVLWGEYYIQLPQISHNLTNGAGAAYTLTSWRCGSRGIRLSGSCPHRRWLY
jgi:hypothetical protein